ncbi:MAG: diacylglycerol kinase family protein [Bacteroidales bacterium]|nr:diacylglycerol kinase family protein [Bacteroidales bacterium]MDD3161364.1 diacylglycerol kinase family protein [Bacteroidales bacterium]
MKPFSTRARLKSFMYAFRGICICMTQEHNAWIHSLITILVISAGLFFRISIMEWIAIFLCISTVFAAEIINTAIERLTDKISPDYHPDAGIIKDLAAGAVLICAFFSVIIGLLIFVPKIYALF